MRSPGLLGWERVAAGSPLLDIAQATLRLQGWSDEAVEVALAPTPRRAALARGTPSPARGRRPRRGRNDGSAARADVCGGRDRPAADRIARGDRHDAALDDGTRSQPDRAVDRRQEQAHALAAWPPTYTSASARRRKIPCPTSLMLPISWPRDASPAVGTRRASPTKRPRR